MLRFPNPGSDIRCLIHLFQSLFEELSDQEFFTLDDMSAAMVMNNLAASCGRMGDAALERSTRDDRSRDPLYNQSKMYSELFRALGWITSTEGSRLNFQFTTLGAYIAKAGSFADKLVKLCIVGIAFPNPVLDIQYETSVRPFVCILRAMQQLDGVMCRDEIILGPMSIRDDRDSSSFSKMIAMIRSYRAKKDLNTPLRKLLQDRGIKQSTSGNYTRFPLGVLKWSQWATTTSEVNIYGRSQRVFYELTSEGHAFLSQTQDYVDYRAVDLDAMDKKTKCAFIENSFFCMLDKANFDLSPVREHVKANDLILKEKNIDVTKTFFSPFQELKKEILEEFSRIPVIFQQGEKPSPEAGAVSVAKASGSAKVKFQTIQLSQSHATFSQAQQDEELVEIWKNTNDLKKAVDVLTEIHASDNKETFYPLVARLFSAAGFPCQTSRTGVNYQRWDASIDLSGFYIPIEIKSPGEEKQLSVKAIRQAVENHIILLSRLKENSKPEHSSLAVGFQYPNDRAEVNELIENVYNAFNFKIGVIDFKALATIAFANAFLKQKMSSKDLESLYGFLDINS